MRHIKRNFCKESALVPVAFTRLQEVLLSDYGRYEQLTAQCYKKQLRLPLSSSDLQDILFAAQRQHE
jgi:hypothetical protein